MPPPAQEVEEEEVVPRLSVPSRNPLPLSASQEGQVRDLFYARVRSYCASEIKEFAACALGRTFTAPFVCRAQRLRMNNCMISHDTMKEQDAAREEWFATRLQRQREREKKETRKREQERFHREWWDLPLEDRDGAKGKEIVRQAERVGGFPKRGEDQPSKDRHR